ncbi:MAG: hypothetical protein FWB74_02145 [Defluviitaleaceae bacterium]|nr:hypothetical protein [Defluviitaleaceae bacterium]
MTIEEIEGDAVGIKYDFTYAELAVEYFRTGSAEVLREIAETGGAQLIFNHAARFGYDVPKGSKFELVSHLFEDQQGALDDFVRCVEFVRARVAEDGFAEGIALEFLPRGFAFEGTIYFTFGYDIGVAFGKDCSLNLGYYEIMENPSKALAWAVHEIHHAGFFQIRGGEMPSLDLQTYGDLSGLMETLTHLEGMGTYAAGQDSEPADELEQEFFGMYGHFKNEPDKLLDDADLQRFWELLAKRPQYTLGAKMAKRIDCEFGRERLTSLIAQPSSDFFALYLNIKQ